MSNISSNVVSADFEDSGWPEVEDMNITITPIGTLPRGCEGSDAYLLLTRCDDNLLSTTEARDWLLPQVYRDSPHPGGYYCHSVTVSRIEYSGNQVIAIVHHRFDV